MSILGYSTCSIQFIPNSTEIPERQYSERTIIELRQLDITDYSLGAKDVENNKTEIFNFRLTAPDQYVFGESDDQPDTINDPSGVYHLWLNEDSRSQFHETFCAILEVLFLDKPIVESSEYVKTSFTSKTSDQWEKPVIPDPSNCHPKGKLQHITDLLRTQSKQKFAFNHVDLLMDVHNLSKFIKQGKGDEADRMARQLASQGLRLQAKSLPQLQKEEEFRILVQFDGNEYGIDQNGGTIPVNVFSSTTVRELRAAFQAAYHYSPSSQYFFVNGKLVHDDFTMRDLNVGLNSLFVLFLIAYPKQFQTNGPWQCSSCTTQNPQDNLKCQLCLASRME